MIVVDGQSAYDLDFRPLEALEKFLGKREFDDYGGPNAEQRIPTTALNHRRLTHSLTPSLAPYYLVLGHGNAQSGSIELIRTGTINSVQASDTSLVPIENGSRITELSSIVYPPHPVISSNLSLPPLTVNVHFTPSNSFLGWKSTG